MPKKRKTTKVNLNKLIDDLIHPYFKQYPASIILDDLLHAIVENNPEKSMQKFLRYNVPKLLKHLQEKPKDPV